MKVKENSGKKKKKTGIEATLPWFVDLMLEP